MNWSDIETKLLSAKNKGKPANNKASVNQIKRLNEWHLSMFIKYFDYYSEQQRLGTFITYRKPILDFLLQDSINNKQFNETTQIDIENYAKLIIEKVNKKNLAKGYLSSSLFALDNYLEYYKTDLTFIPDYSKFDKAERKPQNKTEPLTSKELEDIRFVIKDNKYLKFVFEFVFENKVRFEDMNHYSKTTFLPDENCFLSPSGSKIYISQNLRRIVDEIIDLEEFINPTYKHGYSIQKFRQLLKDNNISRSDIESRDINEAYKMNLLFKCPECGNYYEATAENWIVKQYHQNGSMWIVCKEVCSKK